MKTFNDVMDIVNGIWLLIAGGYCACRGMMALFQWAFRDVKTGPRDFIWWTTISIALLRLVRAV